ncbi:MAG: methionine--tRNA ligase, partial [Pseudomonadales bacterium]|nr:methionine--tRNA ligase [Pseudomonadales bacterium]
KVLKRKRDSGDEERTVVAEINAAYQPEDLQGKRTVMVANRTPRKMRVGTSEGRGRAAGPGGEDIYLLEPHDGARPGMRVT